MSYQPEISQNDLTVIKEMIDKGDLKHASEALKIYMSETVDYVAIFLSGRIAMQVDNYGLAMVIYDWLAERDPRWQTYLNLGKAWDHLNNTENAEACFKKGLDIDPCNLDILGSLGSNLVQQQKPEEVIENSNLILSKDPDNGRAFSNRGFAYLQMRDFGRGWDDYEHGLGRLKWRDKRVYQGEPYWDGEKGKSLYVYCEQGIGDQIAGVEPLNDLQKDCDIKVLDCSPKLKNLFQRSFPHIDVKGDLFKKQIEWANDHIIDASCSVFSVHKYYRRSESSYPKRPYLIADPQRRIMNRALLDSLGCKPKVGIAWTGGVATTNRQARNCSLDKLLPILSQDYAFINLEYRDREREIKDFKDRTGIKIHSFPWILQSEDYDDTAALVAELDFIITVPTAIIHLAGGLGIKTYCMANNKVNYDLSGNVKDIVYYGSIEVFKCVSYDEAIPEIVEKIKRVKRAA